MTTSEKYLAKSTTIAARMLGDETIIMSTVDSTLFTLNPLASVIWEAADGNTPLSQIIQDKICVEFDVSFEQASVDANEFVDKLVEHGILVVSDRPIPQQSETSARNVS